MLEPLIIILLIAWMLGLMSAYTVGGAIHLFLVFALVLIAIRFLARRRSRNDDQGMVH